MFIKNTTFDSITLINIDKNIYRTIQTNIFIFLFILHSLFYVVCINLSQYSNQTGIMIPISESTNTLLFFVLEFAILVGALGVVLLSRVIYSALLLGFVFICVALLYLLLNADFLAAAQVLIYVGAVNVLIVFAIMLVSTPDDVKNQPKTTGEMLSAFTFIALFVLLTIMIFTTSWDTNHSIATQDEVLLQPLMSNVQTIGFHLLTDLLFPFELLSLLLLVALVGAITIASKNKIVE